MWFSIYLKKGTKNDKSDLLNKYLVIHLWCWFYQTCHFRSWSAQPVGHYLPHHFSLELPHLIIEYKDRKSCQVSILPNYFGGIYLVLARAAFREGCFSRWTEFISPEILRRDTIILKLSDVPSTRETWKDFKIHKSLKDSLNQANRPTYWCSI